MFDISSLFKSLCVLYICPANRFMDTEGGKRGWDELKLALAYIHNHV